MIAVELVPLGFGFLIGTALGLLRPSLRLPVGAFHTPRLRVPARSSRSGS